MSLRDRLPAWALDAARSVLDASSPARRRATSSRRRAAASGRDQTLALGLGDSVLAGPFAGMRMSPDASWGGLAARLVGSYEEEIADELLDLLGRQPPRVLDIGAAEGYYAVGVARLLPSAAVLAFDIDPAARRLCRTNARLNGVTNLRVRGRADHGRLRRALVPAALVLCDCEGFEAVLLDPALVPGLRTADLLVELHEFAWPGVTGLLLQRFAATDDVVLVDARPRRGADHPALAHLSGQDADRAVDEGRPVEPHPMQWAVLRVKE